MKLEGKRGFRGLTDLRRNAKPKIFYSHTRYPYHSSPDVNTNGKKIFCKAKNRIL